MSDLTANTYYQQQMQGRTAPPKNSAVKTKSTNANPRMGSIPPAGTAAVGGKPAMGTIPGAGTTPPPGSTPAMDGNPAGIPINPTQNTAGAVIENVKKNPMMTFTTGVATAWGLNKIVDEVLLKHRDYDQTVFKKHILDRLDRSERNGNLSKVVGFFRDTLKLGTLKQKVGDIGFIRTAVNHYKTHAGKLKPKFEMAYGQYQNTQEELLTNLIHKTEGAISSKNAREFAQEFFKPNGEIKPDVVYGNILKKFGINIPEKIDEAFLDSLPKKSRDVLKFLKPKPKAAKLLKKHLEAVEKGNAKAVQKTLRKFINVISDAQGEIAAAKVKNISGLVKENFYHKNGVLNIRKALGALERHVVAEGLDNKELGFIENFAEGKNAVLAVMPKLKGNMFFSGMVENALKSFKRVCRLNDPVSLLTTPLLVGGTIIDTWKAPKGDKLATFMESMTENVASWVLFAPAYRAVHDGINALAKIPAKTTTMKWLTAPFRLAGTALSAGLPEGPALLARFGPKLAKVLGAAGGIGRTLLFFAVVQPFIGKALLGISHKIFGKSQKTIKEENEAKGKKETVEANNITKNPPGLQPVPQLQNEKASPLVSQYMDELKKDRAGGAHVAPANPFNQATPVSTQAGASNLYPDDDVLPVGAASVGAMPAYNQQAMTSAPLPVRLDSRKAAEFNTALAGVDRDIARVDKLLSGY